jgi:CheY-like chemotaxis protein/anti-sigma regulatory factor (Ser/Thr protein kinase)
MRILLVEDHDESREALADVMRREGHDVLAFNNGRDAITALPKFHPQLVLSDFRLPGSFNGVDVLREIKTHDNRILVVLMTAYGCEELAVEALRLGACNYLNKPPNLDYLRHMLDKYAAMIEAQEREAQIDDLFVALRARILMPNDGALACAVAERMLRFVSRMYPQVDTSMLHVGLEEILRNAIEHGNLEIGFESKGEALRANALHQLVEQRCRDERFRNRRVAVEWEIEGDQFRCVIEDEGPGFDYQAPWDPLSEQGLAQINGRGIFLTRAFFDSVEYQGRGNRVVLTKSLET